MVSPLVCSISATCLVVSVFISPRFGCGNCGTNGDNIIVLRFCQYPCAKLVGSTGVKIRQMTYSLRWFFFVALIAFPILAISIVRAQASCDNCLYLPLLAQSAATFIPTAPPTATPTFTPTPIPTATQTTYICDHDAYRCMDFSTQAEAQTVYEYCQALGFGDAHRLDGDNDEIACEGLP